HDRVRVVARRYPCLTHEAIRNLTNGGPRSSAEIGTQIDSFLDEELPGADLFVAPDPRGLTAVLQAGGGTVTSGSRPEPIDLQPDSTYVADTYERAVEHVKELYRNEGFLHAQVGPAQALRQRCDPRSPARHCRALPLPARSVETCTYDATGLPLPANPLDPALTCRPDPAQGTSCAPTMQLVIPVKLGPRTVLWDVAFAGVKSVSEQKVAQAAQVELGQPASTAGLDAARRRIVEWYKERGHAYVDVKYALEPSVDQTRARVRFDVSEGDEVIVGAIVVRGLEQTRESVVRRRIAIEVGQPFRTSDVRKTQERIATLGVFSSVAVSLSEPYVPQPSKTVIVDLVEREPQYVEVRPGFSTGEGARGAVEYAHRNLLGLAWGVTVHVQASYLPDFLILDPAVARNYSTLSTANRVATRDTLTFSWPEMGLGPAIRSQLDGIYVRDLERDFTLVKGAVVGTLIWRPLREIQITAGPSYEHNNVHLFGAQTIEGYLSQPDVLGNVELQRLLRVPDGDSYIFAERGVLTWDGRDSTFDAHRGTYLAAGLEHVDSFPISGTAPPNLQFESHFLRLTQTLAGYIPITSRVSLAAEVRFGEIINVSPCVQPFNVNASQAAPLYCTYPDRLFFMGGFDSMRGWLQDTFIPQEYVDQIAQRPDLCKDSGSNCQGVPLRGGNLMINPRLELRFPIKSPFDAAVFGDLGNLWNDPSYVLNHKFTLRADLGMGIRVQTPVGPLVFDYGVNVTRKSYEDFGAFHFAIGLF
ncbi:MAG: BamA/TamA family outer membrane protein, partial [Myxococcota bacterium]|nr:BamA/TamA family outer membrane protein [Myxococcota bacterium]